MEYRIGFIELGVQIVDVTFAHFARVEVKAPAVSVGLQAHIGQHMGQFTFTRLCVGHRVEGAAPVHDHPEKNQPALEEPK